MPISFNLRTVMFVNYSSAFRFISGKPNISPGESSKLQQEILAFYFLAICILQIRPKVYDKCERRVGDHG